MKTLNNIKYISGENRSNGSNELYFPRDSLFYNIYPNNNIIVIRIWCFPACCGIGITSIKKIRKIIDLTDILQSIMEDTGYKTLFIKNDNYNIKDIVKKMNVKYIKSLNVYSLCKN